MSSTKEPGSAAGRRIRVEVTAADIGNGKPFVQDSCAIAVACKRLGLREVTVVPAGAIRWRKGRRRYAWSTTPEVMAWAVRFDRGEPVEPFAFDMELR